MHVVVRKPVSLRREKQWHANEAEYCTRQFWSGKVLDLHLTQKGDLENGGCPSIAQPLSQHAVPSEFPLPVICGSSTSSTVGMSGEWMQLSVLAPAQSREENEPGDMAASRPTAICTLYCGLRSSLSQAFALFGADFHISGIFFYHFFCE